MSGYDQIDSWVTRCKRLANIANAAATVAAPLVLAAAKELTAKGADPDDGKAWAPKKDGGQPLKNAAENITARAAGSIIQLVLKGHHVFHHYGARGGALPKRGILPDGGAGLPKPIADAIRMAATKEFNK